MNTKIHCVILLSKEPFYTFVKVTEGSFNCRKEMEFSCDTCVSSTESLKSLLHELIKT